MKKPLVVLPRSVSPHAVFPLPVNPFPVFADAVKNERYENIMEEKLNISSIEEIEEHIIKRLHEGVSLKRIENEFKVGHKCNVQMVRKFNAAKKLIYRKDIVDLDTDKLYR